MPRRAPPPDPTPEHQTASDRVSAALPQAVVPDRRAPADRPATKQVRYACGPEGGLEALAGWLRSQGAQVGMGRAGRWVAASDGGSGTEDFLRDNFPRPGAAVSDLYHVAGYPSGWAKALDPRRTADVTPPWCHRWKHEGGEVGLGGLRRIDVSGRPEVVRGVHRVRVAYSANPVHRLDDPAYRATGWRIGSGPVGAACEQVVGQRMRGGGMRWGEAGAEAVCHLRAGFRSEKGQWEAFLTPPAA